MQPTEVANPEYFHKVVDCQWACPAHTPVPEYIRLIAQGRDIPMHMGVMGFTVKEFLKRVPAGELRDGDVWFLGGIYKGQAGVRRLYIERFQKQFTQGHNGPRYGWPSVAASLC